jgi:enoyl-CoA hydratase
VIHWEEPAPHVGLAILDRPDRRNALNAELCDQLRGYLEAAPELRAVVIAGEGTAFCAGADIVRRTADHSGLAHGKEDSFRPAFELLCNTIEQYPAPVIAAVHGPAIGAGTQFAVACDFRVVGPDAVFGIPASKLGIVLSPANVTRLVQLVGHSNARDLLVTSRYVDRDEALRLGLVTRGVEGDTRAEALAFASEIAALAPITVQGHKRAVNLVDEVGVLSVAAADEIRALEQRAFLSDDLQEGLAAFAEKRAPDFRGR